MTISYRRPATPAAVERELRQEAGFGCAHCGHPYIEYHHIVPYSEDPHFRAEDMVALCGNCHPMLAKQGRDRQYAIKRNPYNKKRGIFEGALQYDKRDLCFKVGGSWYENTPIIFQVKNRPIISCSVKGGQACVSVDFFDQNSNIVFSIVDNNFVFRVDDVWDFSYSHNYAAVKSGPRDVALAMDFRDAEATIVGKFWVGKRQVFLGKEETNIGGSILKGARIIGCGVGINIE